MLNRLIVITSCLLILRWHIQYKPCDTPPDRGKWQPLEDQEDDIETRRASGISLTRPFPRVVKASHALGWVLIAAGLAEVVVGSLLFKGNIELINTYRSRVACWVGRGEGRIRLFFCFPVLYLVVCSGLFFCRKYSTGWRHPSMPLSLSAQTFNSWYILVHFFNVRRGTAHSSRVLGSLCMCMGRLSRRMKLVQSLYFMSKHAMSIMPCSPFPSSRPLVHLFFVHVCVCACRQIGKLSAASGLD